jgi:transcriptional regulator with XRE-family HTH domain
MEESEHMSQKALAECVGVSPQYINKVLNGQENLSLQTIAKLSDALNIELISFPKFLFDDPVDNILNNKSSKSQLMKMEK